MNSEAAREALNDIACLSSCEGRFMKRADLSGYSRYVRAEALRAYISRVRNELKVIERFADALETVNPPVTIGPNLAKEPGQ